MVAGSLLTAAYVATRLALLWRFPLFIDETGFASFARDVHGDLRLFFIAESDHKGLLPSWMGAGLIGAGAAPVTAMRLLAAGGAALAAICGGLVMRQLYGLREGVCTAALIALGPYFLVTASVGLYDTMVTGLVSAAILVTLWLAQRPRLGTALLLGAILGAGGLTKATAWAAVVVLPVTLLLFDFAAPKLRRRALAWAGYSGLAVALGYAITSISRLTPYYDKPTAWNHRGLGQISGSFGSIALSNGAWIMTALVEYLTIPGTVLAVTGAIVAWRRNRAAATVLIVWAVAVIVSAILLPRWPNPRYFATAMVPLASFVVLGELALWGRVVGRWRHGPRSGRIAAHTVVLLTLVPAALFNLQVLADPVHATYPGKDEDQYVTSPGALPYLGAIVQEIERRGGPYPVQIDAGPYPADRLDIGPYGLDLMLNGTKMGPDVRFRVFAHGTPARRAAARYVLTDGERSDAAPRPGLTLIRRIARSSGGAVMRLYVRSG